MLKIHISTTVLVGKMHEDKVRTVHGTVLEQQIKNIYRNNHKWTNFLKLIIMKNIYVLWQVLAIS
jgi:hypothetical protein